MDPYDNPASNVIYWFAFDADPGWTTEGDWAFGVPTGGGSGNHDPTSGFTGPNVYGYNLYGDYDEEMPEYNLTTTALDCTGRENVLLSFSRWLGVEDSEYDSADIRVSNNGTSWTFVWAHSGSAISDSTWVLCSYDISAVADNQPTVYIRWVMGDTGDSGTLPGWNIDDVVLSGTFVPMAEVWVDFTHTGVERGTTEYPINSMTEAIDALTDGGTIKIKCNGGDSTTDETPRITKAMRIEAVNGTAHIGEP